jgi:DNA segregation ATPase FtsK/SpoIIIE-like protein
MNSESLYADALAYVREHGAATCADLQRNLLIGYTTARALRDRLEREGALPGAAPDPRAEGAA